MSHKRVEKERYWKKQVARAGRYPEGLRAYCRAEGLSFQSLKYWRRKFGAGMGTASSTGAAAHAFVPVEVIPESRTGTNGERGIPDPGWLAELILHLHRGAR